MDERARLTASVPSDVDPELAQPTQNGHTNTSHAQGAPDGAEERSTPFTALRMAYQDPSAFEAEYEKPGRLRACWKGERREVWTFGHCMSCGLYVSPRH